MLAVTTLPLKIGDINTDLAARRTGMAFQRTRLAADRTLMAVIRTSLSLISFGFTIGKVIEGLQQSKAIIVADHAARNFGVTLVSIGVAALTAGIVYQGFFMAGLRRQRRMLGEGQMLHTDDAFPISFNLVLALVLLLVGVFAMLSMLAHAGPFI